MSTKKSTSAEHSKFWLGNNLDFDKEFGVNKTPDLILLASCRRAIANFVYILTGKNIPVRFAEKSGRSLTDGKVIYIGGELSRGAFDVTVGLSLHESMHIVESDFEIIKNLWQKVPKKIYDAAGDKLSKSTLTDFVKYILNVVEDRFIDAKAYKNAPGYRGYYVALYNRYFNLPKVVKTLKSKAYRKPTLKAYRFRFTALINPHSDLDALPGLREVHDLLDLKNILRLKTPQDRVNMAVDICEIIVKNVVENDGKKSNADGGKEQSEENESDESEEKKGEDDKKDQSGDSGSEESSPPKEESSPMSETISKQKELEEKQKELSGEDTCDCGDLDEEEMSIIEKIIERQEEVINHDIKQRELDNDTIEKLNLLEKSDIDMISVGGDQGVPVTNCLVVKNFTKELLSSSDFPFSVKLVSLSSTQISDVGVRKGIVLGKMLGSKIQVRSEARVTKFGRLDKGKFDQRLISDLGFGSERVFYQNQVDKYKGAHLHISVDASSSMVDKWEKTMTMLVAIAKAASMVNNLSVTISFRSGVSLDKKNPFDSNQIPYVLIAYDSRKDRFNKIVQLFPHLYPTGSTPEGLAFEAILDIIPAPTTEMDSYFINLSDGEPMFPPGYFGQVSWTHTKKQVNKIRLAGIEVLSYFIEEQQLMGGASDRAEGNRAAFKAMYGKDSQVIDVNNVMQIAFTMNKKFLKNDK